MVSRYSPDDGLCGFEGMRKIDEGEYVLYEEHESLQRRYDRLNDKMQEYVNFVGGIEIKSKEMRIDSYKKGLI